MSAGRLHDSGVAGDPASPVHRLDPRAKLLGLTGITLVGVSTPLPAWPAYPACALALGGIALVARVPAAVLVRRMRVVLPLVMLAAASMPFVRGGPAVELGPLALSEAGLATLASVMAKAALGTLAAVLLGATTSFPDVLHALERLRAPRLLVLVAAFMYRYLFVIAEEARRMRAALTARGYQPTGALRVAALGRVVTALFLRTYGRAERIHVAMLARGYDGAMPRLGALALRRADVAFLAAVALLIPVRAAAELIA